MKKNSYPKHCGQSQNLAGAYQSITKSSSPTTHRTIQPVNSLKRLENKSFASIIAKSRQRETPAHG
jgi:hypothetical protein